MHRQLLVYCLVLATVAGLLEAKSAFYKHSSHQQSLAERHLSHGQRQLPASGCSEAEFLCASQRRCISKGWVCDGDNDCGDGTDELQNCTTRPCLDGYVKCSGICMSKDDYCANGGIGGRRCELAAVPVDCPKPQCDADQSACANFTKCVNDDEVCNGYSHCRDGSDEQNCRTHTCAAGMFQCPSDGTCRYDYDRCDGYPNCPDGSDEQNCHNHQCPDESLRCVSDGTCRGSYSRCDGYRDCEDGSDELNCLNYTCHVDSFKCLSDGVCRWRYDRCDGYNHCADGSDELNCHNYTCPVGSFRCHSDFTCRWNYARCDGWDHCADSSDELDCPPLQCDPGFVKCTNRTRCIHSTYVCDNDNDCGDNTDEAAETCSNRTCANNEVPCSNGQCLDALQFCIGERSCRSGSPTRDTVSVCNTTITHSTRPLRSYEVFNLCARNVYKKCNLPSLVKEFVMRSYTPEKIGSKLAQTEMNEICLSFSNYLSCAIAEYDSNPFCKQAEQLEPILRQLRQLVTAAMEFTCSVNVDVINREKSCLLKFEPIGGAYGYRRQRLVLERKFVESCREALHEHRSPWARENPYCIPADLQQCGKNVIADECKGEIATVVDDFINLANGVFCSGSNPPSISTSNKKKQYSEDLELLGKMFTSFF